MPLYLNVNSDDLARNNGRRFNLYGNGSPGDVAPVVVGVRSWDAILAEGRAALEKLRRNLPK